MKSELVLGAICCVLLTLASALSAASVSFTPNPVITQPAQNFTATLRIDSNTLVHGYAVSIHYDSSRLSYVSATRGSLFSGQSILWWRINTDTLNVVNVGLLITGQGYVMGPGNLLNLTFTAVNGDFTQLTVDWMKIYDLSGGYSADIGHTPGDIIIGSQPAYAKIKCWLQGPYANGAMQAALNDYIPLTSPYAADPVTVDAIPSDVVDWALMELRSSYNGQPVASRSLWLGAGGYLRSPGKPYVVMMNSSPGPFYVVIRHRNHLAVMSAAAFQFAASGLPPLLDLTDIASIYGNGGVAQLAPGVIGLIAGDADQSGSVLPSDRNQYWRVQAGLSGYLESDFDLDGTVLPSDRNIFWRVNSGLITLVPPPR